MMRFIHDRELDFLINILAGLAIIPIVYVARILFHAARGRLKPNGAFSLSGFWVGTCKLPRHPPGVEALEIYRMVVRGERVRLGFVHYRPDVPDVLKYAGEGIYRGKLISAFYYLPNTDRSESGVFVVRQVGEKLKGVYAQYDMQADEKLQVSSEDFELQRIDLPRLARAKMLLGLKPYRSFEKVIESFPALRVKVLPERAAQLQGRQETV